jgi:hypothetical protein
MHATMRHYSSREMADLLASRSGEIESLMSEVPGLHGYYLMRTDEGCASMTVCDDEAGTDESARRAADWLRENAADISGTSPNILSGEVIAHAGVTARA